MSQIISSFSFLNLKNQIAKIWTTIVVSILISLGGAGFTVLVATLTDNPIWKLAKDPSEVMQFPPYIGMLSNWGVVLWVSAAAVCLFSAVLLKQKGSTSTVTFLAVSGVFSLWLGMDDLFLLHDRLFPRLFNIPEDYFYFLYLLGFLVYVVAFIRQIIQYEYLLFGTALLLFGVSRKVFVTLPFFNQFMTTGDMLKYFGIVFWLAFFYRTAFFEVSAALN